MCANGAHFELKKKVYVSSSCVLIFKKISPKTFGPHCLINSHFLVHKLFEPMNNYSVKNFKGMCSGFLCCVCGLIIPVHGSFCGFILWIGLSFIFGFCS